MKRFWFLILLSVSAISLYIHYITANSWMTDDAYISFRYAENLINGHGLVFNIGEFVEGYSNFLWVLLIAGGMKLGVSPETSAIFISIICAIGTASILTFFTFKTAKKELPVYSALYPAILFTGIGNYWLWTFGGGLEPILFSFFNTTAILFFALSHDVSVSNARLFFLSILCFVIALTRPEGAMTFVYILFALIFIQRKQKPFAKVLWFITPFVLFFSVYLVWKLSYFGDLIPNTFYAKVDMSGNQVFNGLKYSLKFFSAYSIITIFLLPAVWIDSQKIRYNYLIFGFVIMYAGFVSVVGGDFMFAFRLFVPIVPLLAVLAYNGIEVVFSRNLFYIVIGVTTILSNTQSRFHPELKWEIEKYTTVIRGEKVGKFIAKNFPADAKIAVTAAGAIPYFSKLYTIDMLGLTNREIAHNGSSDIQPDITGHLKYNISIVIQKKPDLIYFGDGFGSPTPLRKAEKELFESTYFQQNYSLHKYLVENDTLQVYVLHQFESNTR
ncbi:MAG: hypothetical protein Q8L88_12930 [Bacteroidota bacterium]|nr:hypothetical protein [Bacteroidota bacterium]